MITHYLDLNVVTKGIHKEMRFLVMDIGQEEVLLGYLLRLHAERPLTQRL
jgi:hypothetical protein